MKTTGRLLFAVFLAIASFLLVLNVVSNFIDSNLYRQITEVGCSDVSHVCLSGGGLPMQLAWPQHPESFGKLQALGDIQHGRIKWFVFGMIEMNSFKRQRNSLAHQGVSLISGGCVIGSKDYFASMAYNRTVKELNMAAASIGFNSR